MYSSPREQVGQAFYLFIMGWNQEVAKGDTRDDPPTFKKLVLTAIDELEGYGETLKFYRQHGAIQKEFESSRSPRMVIPEIVARNLDDVRSFIGDDEIFGKLEEIALAQK